MMRQKSGNIYLLEGKRRAHTFH